MYTHFFGIACQLFQLLHDEWKDQFDYNCFPRRNWELLKRFLNGKKGFLKEQELNIIIGQIYVTLIDRFYSFDWNKKVIIVMWAAIINRIVQEKLLKC